MKKLILIFGMLLPLMVLTQVYVPPVIADSLSGFTPGSHASLDVGTADGQLIYWDIATQTYKPIPVTDAYYNSATNLIETISIDTIFIGTDTMVSGHPSMPSIDVGTAEGQILYWDNGTQTYKPANASNLKWTDATQVLSTTELVAEEAVSVGEAAPDDTEGSVSITGDADSDAGNDVTEKLTFTLVPNADPTTALWTATMVQAAGIDFVMPLIASTLTSDGIITTGQSGGTSGQLNFVASDGDVGDLAISTDDGLEVSGFAIMNLNTTAGMTMNAATKFYPDNGGDTFSWESAADVWTWDVGGTTMFQLTEAATDLIAFNGNTTITPDGANTALTVDQDNDGIGILIDCEATSTNGAKINGKFPLNLVQDLADGYGARIERNIDEVGSFALLRLINDHATDTQATLELQNDGSGAHITTGATNENLEIDPNGTGGVNINSGVNYGVEGQADDDYEISLSGVTALSAGLTVTFIATTANTDGCTLEITEIGDVDAILKMHDQALVTGDIEAGQVVVCVWGGSNWQMTSQLAQ